MKFLWSGFFATLLTSCSGSDCKIDEPITTGPELSEILDCETISGGFAINTQAISGIEELIFPQLKSVTVARTTGDITLGIVIGNMPDLKRVRFDALETASSLGFSANPQLESISAPSLRSVDGSVNVDENPVLESIDLGALEDAKHVAVSSNMILTAVTFPTLRQINPHGLVVTGNAELVSVGVDALTTTPDVDIAGNAKLLSFSAPALGIVSHRVGFTGNASLESIQLPVLEVEPSIEYVAVAIEDNASLESFSFPSTLRNIALTVHQNAVLADFSFDRLLNLKELSITSNPVLTTFHFPAVRSMGSGTIRFNPMLPDCAPVNLQTQLEAADGVRSFTADSNKGDGCPP